MNKKGISFVKGSPMYEVDLQKTDSYSVVVSKIAQALDVDDTTDVVLLTTRGCIIRDELNDTGGGKIQTWTLGGYLGKRHIAPEKLSIVIGHQCVSSQPKKRKIPSIIYVYMCIWLTIIELDSGFSERSKSELSDSNLNVASDVVHEHNDVIEGEVS